MIVRRRLKGYNDGQLTQILTGLKSAVLIPSKSNNENILTFTGPGRYVAAVCTGYYTFDVSAVISDKKEYKIIARELRALPSA